MEKKMPKHKKPNRKSGVKKVVKRFTIDGSPGGVENAKPEIAKNYGSAKSAVTKSSPARTQRSARSR
jgi:hypothetical protein